jgi:23S rRNA (guanosine2251-2'-O)-methyltransferase
MKSDLIIGRNPVIEALRSNAPVEKIFIAHGSHGKPIGIIKSLARQRGIVVAEVDRQKFREITGTEHSQGVAAVAGIKEYVDLETIVTDLKRLLNSTPPFLLILDEITDPHNTGALIRTAECAGVNAVVISKHNSAPLTGTIEKTSAGAVTYMPIARETNIVRSLEYLKENGYWIIGTEGTAEQSYTDVDYTMPLALVIGSEGKGIRRLVKEKCDFLVRIPLHGKIESLNASVAGAIVMYEVVRQRSLSTS